MNDIWKTIKLGVYVFALPLVATAAASAHQWMTVSTPITMPEAVMTTVSTGAVFSTVRNHTITVDDDGVVRGRLVTIDPESYHAVGLDGLKIYFARNGEVVKRVETLGDGTFKVEGLEEGAYSFIASGESGFAAYGVNVVMGDSAPTVMEVAAVSPKFDVVQNILENRVPPRVAAEIAELASSNNEESAPIALEGSNRVIIEDGVLVGSVVSLWGQHKSIAGTSVHIVQNEEEVAMVRVNESGNFKISDLTPGVYGFIAAGPAGFAAISFEAVEDDSALVHVSIPVNDTTTESGNETDTEGKEVITVTAADYGNVEPSASLYVCLTSPQDSGIVSDTVMQADQGLVDDYVAPPIEYAGEVAGQGCAAGAACGGAGDFSGYGSCCGGGGGGGGGGGAVYGGGMGRLIGLAALGIGVAALATGGGSGEGPDMSPFQP